MFKRALSTLDSQADVTRDVGKITSARGVVLPGVGAFQACMENLGRFGLIEPIREVVRQKKPFLGICLGFQLLFSESEEFGKQKGLDLFPGKVVGFQANNGLKVPHMGWNCIEKKKASPFLEGIASGDYVYFVHSFYVVPDDPSVIATTTDYGSLLCLQHRNGSPVCLSISPGEEPGDRVANPCKLRPLRRIELRLCSSFRR